MKQIIVKGEGKEQEITELCEALGRRGINIISLFGGKTTNGHLFYIITEDEVSAEKAFKQAGFEVTVKDFLPVKIPDKPGELAKITRRLLHSGTVVKNIFLITREKDYALIGIETDDIEKAREAVRK